MKNRHSIAKARLNLPALIREAYNGKEVELTRRDEPVAVLISLQEFKQLILSRSELITAYRNSANTTNLSGLELNHKELLGDVYEKIKGRNNRL